MANQPPSKNLETALAIRQRQQILAESIAARQYERQPAIWKDLDNPGRLKSVRDAGYHLTYLSEALAAGDPALFTAYLGWVKVLFAGLKFGSDVLPATIESTRLTLTEHLPPEVLPAALEYLDAGLRSLDSAPTELESFITPENPLQELARSYLDHLLRGERQSASQMILNAAEHHVSIKNLYLYVFQASQREIGRLWQTNQISVAQEHYCTAATQLIMSQLYPYIFAGPKKGLRLVATCVSGELHEIGARMVADFFELDGWDTYFLGANIPVETIVRTVEERQPHILAISATMTFHVDKVVEMIAKVRSARLAHPPKIIVGGYPFNIAPSLWQKVGADGSAGDALEAIVVAERILA